jgi:ATP-binding cassette subfamily B protein
MIKKTQNRLRAVWFFLEKYKVYFGFLIGLAILSGLLESLNVALMYPIISEGLDISTSSNVFLNAIEPIMRLIPIKDELIRFCVVFIFVAIAVFLVKIVYYYSSAKFASKVVVEAKQDVFNKCINADYQFFVDNKQGEVLYKTANAPNSIAQILQIMSNIFVELFLSLSVFTVLLSMSWKMLIIVLIGGICYYYLTRYLSWMVSYRAGKKILESGQQETAIVSEYTSGIKHIKVFETFSYWGNLFNKVINVYWFHRRRNFFWQKFPEILIWFVMYLCIGVAVIIIKIQYPGNFKTLLPLLGTFAFGVFLLLPRLSRFGMFRMNFMNVLPNVETVYNMLRDKSYFQIQNGEKEFTGLKKGIEFKNVTFSYKERDVLLDKFSLQIKKGLVTALVGPSGSGKSTIVNLLLRLYDVNKGSITVDDVNIKDYDIFTFREKIGFVSQDSFIYNASIKDNIAFGGNYTEEEIVEAAILANADDFIRKFPDGYDTLVGDRGMRVSGGEQQRIAIARAIIRKPEIIILDEATSSLDNVSESLVQQAINNISRNCTTFIIAHRLSTIQDADVINVLEKGKIVEKGNHKNLLKKKGKYWKLSTTQKK